MADLFHGRMVARFVRSLTHARGDYAGAAAYANSQRWPEREELVGVLRAAVEPHTAAGAAALLRPLADDFLEVARPMTALGKLTQLHRVPLHVRLLSGTGGATAWWAGEAQPAPLSAMNFAGETLEQLRVDAVLVATRELVTDPSADAERRLSQDLGRASAEAIDGAFLDPGNAGEAGVKPASVTYGVDPIVSSGATVAAVDADLKLMLRRLVDSGSDLSAAAWILHPQDAVALSLLRGSGGAPAFPFMTARGGTLVGLPAVTTANVKRSGSPGSTTITLLDQAAISVGDEGGATLEVATHASLQMVDDPVDGAASMVSLWQAGAVGIKSSRYLNWKVRRPGAVQVLAGVSL
ncbi:phage major capsid protein [Piscinibacter defluvii]|uniref:phage major capsid protein n=1 Tax=Piscinibacter defluvii TaxID=1796922 RepID=UPI000FDF12A8|nr:phage major capsid protein [Piscinibacter defluvii]